MSPGCSPVEWRVRSGCCRRLTTAAFIRARLSNRLPGTARRAVSVKKTGVYIDRAVRYSAEAVNDCLRKASSGPVLHEEIDALFYISTTGLSTPSIEARLMNVLPFSPHAVRVPIWGLGCAGGAAGLARAADYCRAFPNAKALVIAVEFCSLTFQLNDWSKSNVIGTSRFFRRRGVLACGWRRSGADSWRAACHRRPLGAHARLGRRDGLGCS